MLANHAPGFIANRIGVHEMVQAIRLMEDFDFTIDEVDALTGRLISRPKSATLRPVVDAVELCPASLPAPPRAHVQGVDGDGVQRGG
jgi:hypothetical protein